VPGQETEEHKKYFTEKYKEDTENQKKQTWKDYWNWIQKFYRGTFFSAGWLEIRNELLLGLDKKSKKKTEQMLNELGKKISAEWAKDNGVRKIDTGDVKKWANYLRAAKKKDAGDGTMVLKAVREIESEANKKLKKTKDNK